MSLGFRAVQWNREKIVYDAILLGAVAVYIGFFLGIVTGLDKPKTFLDWIDIPIRAFGSCAFIMLTIVLAIGPLARIDRRFLPLLYNRRHFGVLTFIVAAVHASWMVEWYAAQNALPNIIAELTKWTDYAKFIGFPFKTLGLTALVVLFLMAATSHDFWLVVLTPRVWKSLHMAVYVAYALVVMHVALGYLQDDRTPVTIGMLIVGFGSVAALHLVAGSRERTRDRGVAPGKDGWLPVGPAAAIPDKAALIVAAPGGERIAVFRDGAQIGALTNLCAHQEGPLGEGRIIDGFITCPWHGYQYRLADGCAPPPFPDKLATYRVRLRDGVVEVDPHPLPPGTPAAITCPPQTL
ncbi:MAG TPA: Rieske 2Fe-2S domain-containing protein [Xanthobacteraceae bacterium]|jgi:DMSO/TMAO reductase YedYZ heme-binding membrane subunit/nitrite reductase/ring-hydroxylating ferredoxin subunit